MKAKEDYDKRFIYGSTSCILSTKIIYFQNIDILNSKLPQEYLKRLLEL